MWRSKFLGVDPDEDTSWQKDAACAGSHPALFFPTVEYPKDCADAKAVCAGCVVRFDCLEYALRVREPAGIWGGLATAHREWILQQARERREGVTA